MAIQVQADIRRRRFGVVFLGTSALMILAGETFLSNVLKENPLLTVIYWLACLMAVLLAILIAFADWKIMRKRLHAEHRGLVEETLEKFSEEKAHRGQGLNKQQSKKNGADRVRGDTER